VRVNTVLGPVDVTELGVVHTHEHLLLDLYRVRRVREMLLNDLDLACDEVSAFKAVGGGTLFEVTTPDMGRSPRALCEISRRTGIHIVMGTGRYRQPFYEPALWQRTTADLAAEFVRDLEVGVDGVRAGLIGEIGIDGYAMSPIEERVHRAAARAHRATGAPISTHAIAAPVGLHQLDIFEEEGVDLRRVVIGHCDSFPFIDYHDAVIARGAFVQFDLIRGSSSWRFADQPGQPGSGYELRREVQLVVALARAGHLDRMLFSHDIFSTLTLAVNGGPGYVFILTRFLENLRAAGIGQAQLDMILIENPRRLLSGTN
jgi:phosphotriesterase-related protein